MLIQYYAICSFRSSVDIPHTGQWREALTYFFICAWTNTWANNRDAGYLDAITLIMTSLHVWRPVHKHYCELPFYRINFVWLFRSARFMSSNSVSQCEALSVFQRRACFPKIVLSEIYARHIIANSLIETQALQGWIWTITSYFSWLTVTKSFVKYALPYKCAIPNELKYLCGTNFPNTDMFKSQFDFC